MIIVVESMSRQEAAATRRPELREMKCVIVQHCYAPKHYWMPNSNGYTDDLQKAGLYSLADALSFTPREGYSILFVKEGEPEPGPDGKVRRRMSKLVLGHSLYAMVEASPNNPTVRAHVMAKIGRMPPDELDTLQKIVDWIECDIETLPGEKKMTVGVDLAAPATRPTPTAEAFVVMTRNRENEHGTCNYRQTNTSQSAVPISRELIMSALEDNEDNLEAIVDEIADQVNERACNYERNHDIINTDHDDYECSETFDREVEFSRHDLTNQIAAYLRQTLTREQLDDLGL